MKLAAFFLLLTSIASAQTGPPAPTSVTVPITLDHNRIIIDVRFTLPDGSAKRVRGWVDSGNPELTITGALAKKLGLELTGETHDASSSKIQLGQPPKALLVGGMALPTTDIKQARIVLDRDSIGPGLSAEVNLPSTMLRNYDVIVDYPNRELTIATPGAAHFEGPGAKALLNARNGLIQLPSKVADEATNLGLDLGSSFSFISSDMIGELRQDHPDWPHLRGAIGPANFWGLDDEPQWDLLRVAAIQLGGTALTNVAVASFPQQYLDWFQARAGVPSSGLIGANALLSDRVGLDYAHSTVYIQQVSKTPAPDMDVVGLTLRPEADGKYSILGISDFDGKPSVPDARPGDVLVAIDKVPAAGGTMGEVWSLLGGSPGDVRALTLERDGKKFQVNATVHRFLAPEAPQKPKPKKK